MTCKSFFVINVSTTYPCSLRKSRGMFHNYLCLSFERPICDATGVTLEITKVANSSYNLHGWLWVEVTEELWDTSHDEITKNNLTSVKDLIMLG